VLDVEAVLNRVPGEPCDIVAISQPGNGAIEYAAVHPEDVANLVIIEPTLRGEQFAQDQLEVIHSLAEHDETLWSENVARWVLGWERGRLAHVYADFIRSSINREDAQRIWRENVELDSMSILPRLTARVLVISNPMADRDRQHAREVAAAISDAELVEIADTEVRGAFMNAGETSAINEFLGLMPKPPDEITPPSGTAIILFADIADSTALTERLGDAAFREKARELDEALRRAIASNGGTAIDGKLLGDGVLATFGAAREAIACASACHAAAKNVDLALHVGIHAGDVIRENDNVYGGAVNIASRISELAAPGEVLVSRTVADLARTSAGVSFDDRGDHELKGIDGPVRVFAVRSE
jgi:class 3 adenylate cyclase